MDELLMGISFCFGMFGIGTAIAGHEKYEKYFRISLLFALWAVYVLLWGV